MTWFCPTVRGAESAAIMVTKLQQISSAIFYSGASILIILVNKFVLTSFHFPSFKFLGLAQICATVLILGVARITGECVKKVGKAVEKDLNVNFLLCLI